MNFHYHAHASSCNPNDEDADHSVGFTADITWPVGAVVAARLEYVAAGKCDFSFSSPCRNGTDFQINVKLSENHF